MNMNVIKLVLAALAPAAAALGLYMFFRTKTGKKLPEYARQLLAGIVFGLLAILGTAWGIHLEKAVINCRDAAVLIAGSFFGGPAGILAGLIGGIARWFVGGYTRTACTVSTILAGFLAAVLRRFILRGRKPGYLAAAAEGAVIEVFHLTMVFITNIGDASGAIEVVRACSVPMICANALSVMLASLLIAGASGRRQSFGSFKLREMPVFDIIRIALIVVVCGGIAVGSIFVYTLENNLTLRDTASMLSAAITEIRLDLADAESGAEADAALAGIAVNRHVGTGGFLLVVDADKNVVTVTSGVNTEDFRGMHIEVRQSDGDYGMGKLTAANDSWYYMASKSETYTVFVLYPVAEAMMQRDITVYLMIYMLILIYGALYAALHILIRYIVVDQLRKTADSLARISGGDLEQTVNLNTGAEFASLSRDINHTVDTLKHLIAEAAARIDAELALAAKIQSSALPDPAGIMSRRTDMTLAARMSPAKEVGGDFYDFYFTSDDRFNFMIADVSGKGIPGALFMMRAKSILRKLSEQGLPPEQVFTDGSRELCTGNDAELFVTAWQGTLDTATGLVTFANAGHNPPVLRHDGGPFAFITQKRGLVLAAMDTVVYRRNELRMSPGDMILLYTDGVTEATDAAGELYGDDRLLRILNARAYDTPEELLTAVRADVDAFVGAAPQFDDLTMVALRYNG